MWAPLVVRAHRADIVLARANAVRANAGVVARLGECVLETAQPAGREIDSFHVRTGPPQRPQRRHVDRLPATGLRLLAVVLGVGRLHPHV
ncbi:hypothetical protein [Streptomyces sp. NPDC007355]|uniref:hypothetical protein n=1 Tax=unclassified Streptomyces TaxID=2593676 RepID=UPI0036905D50